MRGRAGTLRPVEVRSPARRSTDSVVPTGRARTLLRLDSLRTEHNVSACGLCYVVGELITTSDYQICHLGSARLWLKSTDDRQARRGRREGRQSEMLIGTVFERSFSSPLRFFPSQSLHGWSCTRFTRTNVVAASCGVWRCWPGLGTRSTPAIGAFKPTDTSRAHISFTASRTVPRKLLRNLSYRLTKRQGTASVRYLRTRAARRNRLDV